MSNKSVSNNVVVALLAVALLFSIGSTVVSVGKINQLGASSALTGAATGTGTTAFTVGGTANIDITNGSVQLGSGYINKSCTLNLRILTDTGTAGEFANSSKNCWLDSSNGAAVGVVTLLDNHTIENNGTSIINLSMSVNKNNTYAFYCGGNGDSGECVGSVADANASVYVKAAETAGTNRCLTSGGVALSDWQPLLDQSATGNYTRDICADWDYGIADPLPAIVVYFNLTLPRNIEGGLAPSMTVTYTGATG